MAEDQRGGHRIVALLDTSPSAPASPEGSHPAVEEAAAWVEPGRSLQDGEGSQQARPRRSLDTVDVSVTLMSELSYSVGSQLPARLRPPGIPLLPVQLWQPS